MTDIFAKAEKLWQRTPFSGPAKPLVTHLRLAGTIGGRDRFEKGLNLALLEKALTRAFDPDSLQAVAISVNSPGGSPVQSRLIHDRIRMLADKKKVPVLSFIEDVGASGGYILAAAGDEIFADESSIIGSIGVIAGGFGFPKAIEKLGIERRIYTAGDNKSQLDPFHPEKVEDLERMQEVLTELHQVFIALVKERRGEKIDSENENLFSGMFWPARPARELGLIDSIGHMRHVIEQRFGDQVVIRNISLGDKGLLSKITSQTSTTTPLLDSQDMLDTVTRQSLWSHYGL